MLLGERTISRRRENTVVSALGVVSVTSCCVHLHSQVTRSHSLSMRAAWSFRNSEGIQLRRSIDRRSNDRVVNDGPQPGQRKKQSDVLGRIKWHWCCGSREGSPTRHLISSMLPSCPHSTKPQAREKDSLVDARRHREWSTRRKLSFLIPNGQVVL
jgi:hypothetical protein